MKNFKRFTNFFIVKISRGEEIQKSIEEFCKKSAKNGGYFIGIGALESVTLAHYNIAKKKYSSETFKEPLELTNLCGNVCFSEGKMIIHSHAAVADKNFKTISGHLVEAKVSGACEIIFFPFSQKIKKEYDKETGLKLMKL